MQRVNIVLLLVFSAAAVVNETAVLFDFYEALNGPQWAPMAQNWNASTDICRWYGVTCTNGNVTMIKINNVNVTGTLPASLDMLSQLARIDIAMNGRIVEIADLTSTPLTAFSAASTGSDDVFAASLCNLPSTLLRLDIGVNLITRVPDCVAKFTGLFYLNLGNNRLTQFPPIYNLPLRTLILDRNRLFGNVPTALSKMTTLETLNYQENRFSGCALDTSLLVNLTIYYFNDNFFTGVPIFSTLPSGINSAVYFLGNPLGTPLPYPFENSTSLPNPCLPVITAPVIMSYPSENVTVHGKYLPLKSSQALDGLTYTVAMNVRAEEQIATLYFTNSTQYGASVNISYRPPIVYDIVAIPPYITIYGANLMNSPASPTVSIDGREFIVISAANDTIVCTIENASFSGTVSFSVGDVTINWGSTVALPIEGTVGFDSGGEIYIRGNFETYSSVYMRFTTLGKNTAHPIPSTYNGTHLIVDVPTSSRYTNHSINYITYSDSNKTMTVSKWVPFYYQNCTELGPSSLCTECYPLSPPAPSIIARRGEASQIYKAKKGDTTEIQVKRSINAKYDALIYNEANIMKRLHHPKICASYGVYTDLNGRVNMMIEDAGEQTLEWYISQGQTDSPYFSQKVHVDVLDALLYIHSQGIVHGYVHPNAIICRIVDRQLVSKICSLTYAREEKSRVGHNMKEMEKMRDERWKAPEEMRGMTASEKSDVWSYGITIWTVYNGMTSLYEGSERFNLATISNMTIRNGDKS